MSRSADNVSIGQMATAISNDVVRVLYAQTGRRPARARTTITGDLVVCLLYDTLTVAERTLVDAGHTQAVLDTRKLYQQAMRPALSAAVETHTGRRVVAFMSDNNIDPDTAIEAFILESEPGETATG